MIVVGSPLHSSTPTGSRAAGPAVAIARAARAAGADVEIVGRIGEDAAGEAVLLDLATAGIGHVAILRDPARPTGEIGEAVDPDDGAFDDDPPGAVAPGDGPAASTRPGPPLDAEDLDLALRYVPDYRVLVVADAVTEAALAAALRVGAWSNASIVVILPAGAGPVAGIPPDATVLEAPDHDPDDAFARMVGTYAAALDRGEPPAEAFAAVSASSGWSAAAPD